MVKFNLFLFTLAYTIMMVVINVINKLIFGSGFVALSLFFITNIIFFIGYIFALNIIFKEERT